MDDSDLTMGSGTFGGIGSGNGVTPPAMPRTTLCVPDGPAACTVYELALDGSGNTTGAPAMDEQGDSTRQTTWRPFLSEPATLLHVVNGDRRERTRPTHALGGNAIPPPHWPPAMAKRVAPSGPWRSTCRTLSTKPTGTSSPW